MNRSNRLVLTLVALAALSAGVLAANALRSGKSTSFETATVLQTPRPIADGQWLSESGETVTIESLRGQWHLLFAGFTSCPDICPSTLSQLNRVVQPLGEDAPLRVLLLSVDPARDTPQKLKPYLAAFNPHFGGLTGEDKALQALRTSLGLVATQVSQGAGYTVDHSSSLVLLDPEARIVAYFSPPFDEGRMSKELENLIKKKA